MLLSNIQPSPTKLLSSTEADPFHPYSQPGQGIPAKPKPRRHTASPAAMDPLSVLRDYAARNELDKIIFSGDEIHFGSDYTFPASTPTAFASKQSGRP